MTIKQFLNVNYLCSNSIIYPANNIDIDAHITEISIKDIKIISKITNKPLHYITNLILEHL